MLKFGFFFILLSFIFLQTTLLSRVSFSQSNSNSPDEPPPEINGVNLLHAASFQGHTELVTALLTKKTFPINSATPTGSRALHVSAYNNHPQVVKTLLDFGAEVDVRDNSSFTPLHVAAQQGHASIVRILLESGADITARNEAGSTSIHIAIIDGHIDVVKILIEFGADINSRDFDGVTGLHTAVIKENKEIVEYMLSKKALVNTMNRYNLSPLYSAILKENVEILSMLLKVPKIIINYKVDIESMVPSSNSGTSSGLKSLADRKGEDVFDTSSDKGGDDKKYITPLYKACNSNNTKLLDLLLAHGAKIGRPTITGGLTCLHKAALSGDLESLEIFSKHKVDLNIPEEHGYTSLHVASQTHNNENFIKKILSLGADVNIKSNTGITPLHLALSGGKLQNSVILLQNGAKVTLMDNDEKIPFSILLENESQRFSSEEIKFFKTNSIFKVAMAPLSYWKTSEMFVWLNSVGERLIESDREEFSLIYHKLVSSLEQEEIDDVDELDDVDQFGASHSRIVEESASSVLKKLRNVLSEFQERIENVQSQNTVNSLEPNKVKEKEKEKGIETENKDQYEQKSKVEEEEKEKEKEKEKEENKKYSEEEKKQKNEFYDVIRNYIKQLKNGLRNGPGFESFWKKAWKELEENHLIPKGFYEERTKPSKTNSAPSPSTPLTTPASDGFPDEIKDLTSNIL